MNDIQDLDAFTEAEGRRLLAAAFETAPTGAALTGDGLAGAELLRRVRRRTSRRRVRSLAPVGAVAALGGAAALAVTLTATVAGAPSAQAAVTAAAAKTSADSFRVAVSLSQGTGKPVELQVTGVFDLRRGVGEETVNGTEVRFVGGRMYAKSADRRQPGKTWLESPKPAPVPSATAGPAALKGFVGLGPIEPGALLGLLKSAASVQAEGPASGPDWTGTRYALTFPRQPASFIVTESGTVDVDNQGRVRRLVTTIGWRLSRSSADTTRDFTSVNDMTFWDFGVRVSVTAPPASQVGSFGPGSVFIGSRG